MLRPAARRFGTTLVVVLSLLFSQLALANYICSTASPAGDMASAMEMAPGEPCEGMAEADKATVLCHQHCTDAPQSFDAVKLPAVSLPAVLHVLTVPLGVDRADQRARVSARGGGPRPPEPLFLSTLRLRV